jgi:hypothetical protein
MGTHQKEEHWTGDRTVHWRSGVILATDGPEPRIVLRLEEFPRRCRFCEAGAGAGPKPSRPVSERVKNGKTGERNKPCVAATPGQHEASTQARPGDGVAK